MANKKKVLHLIQSLDHGGCEVMLLRVLPLLPDFEHTVITLKEPGELAPQFLTGCITVETIRYHGIFDIPGVFRLRKLVRAKKPDIVITYLFHADMLGRLALSGTTDASIVPFLRTTYNHPRYLIARVLERLTRPLVKMYLANSEIVKEYYVKNIGVAPDAITVIPNGLDTAPFDILQPDPKLRESLGITSDDFTIICVANLAPNKGLHYLLEAFDRAHTDFPHLQLLLIGAGVEHARLLQQVANYRSKTRIHFLGRRTDVINLLKIADCFILPTLFEGMSTVLLEAMNAGLTIITTDIPENRILIQHRVTGVLVMPRSSEAIALALRDILEKPDFARTLGANAKAFVREHFSLTRSLALFKEFLHAHTL